MYIYIIQYIYTYHIHIHTYLSTFSFDSQFPLFSYTLPFSSPTPQVCDSKTHQMIKAEQACCTALLIRFKDGRSLAIKFSKVRA